MMAFHPSRRQSLTAFLAARAIAYRVKCTQGLYGARQHFAQMKRLTHIIIGSEFETDNSVDGVFSSADDDNSTSAARVQFAQQIKPIVYTEIKIK